MRRKSDVLFTTLFVIAISVAATPAYSQFSVVHNFGTGGASDPCQPQNSGIIAQGQDGNLYGIGPSCGAHDGGSAFTVTPSSGAFADIYDFSTPGGAIFAPFGGLTLDPTSGNFYGTTQGGGTAGDGTLFSITPAGSVGVLHNFTGASDGYTVDAPPIVGLDGNLYGTSRRGGNFVTCAGTGCGVVYKMTPSGTLIWSHEFDITHGLYPYAPLVQGTDGNFYGTTQEGGTGAGLGSGTVFQITPAGVLTVLHNFCSKAACTDGQYPFSPLIQGNDGNFYGTTILGGANGFGEIFKITPSGALTVLHSMKSATDGQNPYGGLVLASDGNFYGTNQLGGTHNGGTMFQLTPSGIFTVLHNFDGTTGAQPMVTLIQHTNGTLYGDTYQGGTASEINCAVGTCGVFYKYGATGLKPFIKLVPATSGKVGSKVGILGQGFDSTSVIKFNGVTATTRTVTGTSYITATVPSGASDGYVTVTTGITTLKSLQKFIVHNSWGRGAAMPTAVNFPAGSGTINGKIYVVGGNGGSGAVADNQIYNPTTNTWTTGAALPTATYAAASAVVNNVLYIFGGTANGFTASNAVWAYNPTTNTWTMKAAMPTARFSAAAAVKNNIIYVIGGNGSTLRLNTVESYNPATNTWTEEKPLLVGKSEPSVGLVGTTIVAADGYTSSGDTGDNEGYNTSTNTWSALTSDPTLRNGACYGSISGQLYVTGGWDNGAPALKVTSSFSETTDKWTTLAPLPQAVTVPGSAVNAGLLYCFGGTTVTAGTNAFNYVQIYQP